jgi:predicted AlkP superfamily pyrophosphatase or phosphodiesterase
VTTLVTAGAVDVLHQRSTPPSLAVSSSAATAQPKYLVLMVLDGARPDYFDMTPLPHLDALRTQGTQYTNAIDGILEAETPAGHATIATGSRPDQDGILGFDWANDNDRYSLFDPAKMGSLEQIMQDAHAPTIAGLYKKTFPRAQAVAISGHKYYAAAPLGGPSADAIIYYEGDAKGRYVPAAVPGHTPPASVLNAPGMIDPTTHLPDGGEDNLATRMAINVVKQMQPRLLLMNYPEFDWPLGHVYGGNVNPAKVSTDMQAFDADLGRIEAAYQAAGILNQTLFVITADHGMMPVTRFIPSTVVTNAVAKAGTSAPDIAANTADYVWLADSSKAQAVAQNVLSANDPGIQSAYYLTTQKGHPQYVAAGQGTGSPAVEVANQYLLQALLNGHEPQVVIFGNEGASFSDPSYKWKADHGGGSWESQHIPLVLAGPGIKPGQTLTTPAQLEDVAPTVLADMGVTPTGMGGNVLTDALYNPSSAATKTRTAEIGWLGPVVTALSSLDQASTSSQSDLR